MNFISRKFKRRSLRIKSRDYSRDGYYFVTICARNRENLFANLCVGVGLAPTQDPDPNIVPELILTTAGRIVEKNWHKIALENIITDAFVIMPNHIHGIINIKRHAPCVGAGLAPAPTLGNIIGSFKSRCVRDYLKYIDENDLNESAKIWQRNYYEHIIRDKKELNAIRSYIKLNPAKWEEDEDNPLNL